MQMGWDEIAGLGGACRNMAGASKSDVNSIVRSDTSVSNCCIIVAIYWKVAPERVIIVIILILISRMTISQYVSVIISIICPSPAASTASPLKTAHRGI